LYTTVVHPSESKGKPDESNEVHDRLYIPAAEAYQASMTALVKIQRDRIDALRLRN
jgi:uncharacterized protein with FMN-binding domain